MKKIFFILFLLTLIFFFYFFGGSDFLTFEYVKVHLEEFILASKLNPVWVQFIFFLAYVTLTSLSIPGSIVLTILAGAVFGTFKGVILVNLAGTIGATLAFLISRFLMRNFITAKLHKQFIVINRNLKKDGILFLLSLRLIPVSPFVVINLTLGLSKIKVWTFFWTTFLGMIPGNIIYVYAGLKISQINKPSEILSPTIILAITLLGLLPLMAKKIFDHFKKKVINV